MPIPNATRHNSFSQTTQRRCSIPNGFLLDILRLIEEWMVRMVTENRSWGYDRLAGALADYSVALTT
jgi:hypothetical protein